MNIGQLKELIKDLPDDMPVVECREGNVGSWTEEAEPRVGTVYKFYNVRNYGANKGQKYIVEYSKVYKGREEDVISSYTALIFDTAD